MKRIIGALLTGCLLLSLAGCGSDYDSDTSTIFVKKDSSVVGVTVESLDKDYYDEEALSDFVDEEMSTYYEEHDEDSVKKDSLEVKDEEAKLKMEYASGDDYAEFNGVTFFTGTVVQAQAAGFEFDTDFTKVEKGEATDDKVSSDDVLAEEDLKVLILEEAVNVEVSGNICYVSKDTVEVTGNKTATVAGDQDAEYVDVTYIIYK